jgi:hypothetical protein
VWVSFYLKTNITESSSWTYFWFYSGNQFDYNTDSTNWTNLIKTWTWITDWSYYEFPINSGYNVIKWCNLRDYQDSFVTNNVWLDDVSIIESFTNTWNISWSGGITWSWNITNNNTNSWSTTWSWNTTTDSTDNNYTNSWTTSWNENTSWSGSVDLWNWSDIYNDYTNSWTTTNDNWNTENNSWGIIIWSKVFPNYAVTLDPNNPLLGIIVNDPNSDNIPINQWNIGSGILILPNDTPIEKTNSWSTDNTNTTSTWETQWNTNTENTDTPQESTNSWSIDNTNTTSTWETQWNTNTENTDTPQKNTNSWSIDNTNTTSTWETQWNINTENTSSWSQNIPNETNWETETSGIPTTNSSNNTTTDEPSINQNPWLVILPDDHPIISENSNINNYPTNIVGVGSWIFIAPSDSTIIADNTDEKWNFTLPPDASIVVANVWVWAFFNPCNRVKIWWWETISEDTELNSASEENLENENAQNNTENEYDYSWISEATKIETWAKTNTLVLFAMIMWIMVIFFRRILNKL